MSLLAMSWAFKQKLPGLTKLVLLALADNANDDGVCWPGLQYIAKKCGMSKPTIINHMKTLQNVNLLHIKNRHNQGGKQISNYYSLNLTYAPEPTTSTNNFLNIGGKTITPGTGKTITSTSGKTITPLIEPIINQSLIEPSTPLDSKFVLDDALMEDSEDEPLEITSIQITGKPKELNPTQSDEKKIVDILSIIQKHNPETFKKARGKAIHLLIKKIHNEAELARARSNAHPSMLASMKTRKWGQIMAGRLGSEVFVNAQTQEDLNSIVTAWLAIIEAYYVDKFWKGVAVTTNSLFKFAAGKATGGSLNQVVDMDQRVLADRFRSVVLIHSSYISNKLKIRFRQKEIFVSDRIDAVWEDKLSDDDDEELRDCEAIIKVLHLCDLGESNG